jgi:hypothetical protein
MMILLVSGKEIEVRGEFLIFGAKFVLTSPHIIASILNKVHLDVTVALQTSMQSNMELADSSSALAAGRNIEVTSSVHTRSTVCSGLGKRDHRTRKGSSVPCVQRAIHPL